MNDTFAPTPPPWSTEQVGHLEAWQNRPLQSIPTYTCGGTDTSPHTRVSLIPGAAGWHCPAPACPRDTFPGTFAGVTDGTLRKRFASETRDLRAWAGEGPLAGTQVQIDDDDFWCVLGLTNDAAGRYTGMSCLMPTEIAIDWAVREYPAAMLAAAGLTEQADKLRSLPEITAERLDQRTALRRHNATTRAAASEAGHVPPPVTDRRAVSAFIGWAAPAPGLAADVAYNTLLGSGRMRDGGPGHWSARIVRNLYDGAADDTARYVLAETSNRSLDELLRTANRRAGEDQDLYEVLVPERLVLTPQEV
ncbi:hypothetical protein [Tsukamurella columbiensis]|uniref:DNA primase n=1 Tax=Tsukamurella columbiensis TaxID=128509 RepID=A0ABX1LJ85_9ACTN|nr:hypothetical protein [Tsukamurella columbiensis]NMD58322.1 hypothetical protein [Tsukamurella columbiensis]